VSTLELLASHLTANQAGEAWGTRSATAVQCLLTPTRNDISAEFLRGFESVTEEPVSRDELIAARQALVASDP
jgi:hypothetical protein